MAIPDFQTNGELFVGIYDAVLAEIRQRFGYNLKRLKLLDGLTAAVNNLQAAGVQNVYIDGSFITSKAYPSDIDGCWDAHNQIDLNILDPVFLDFRSHRKAMKQKYGVDFFIAQIIEGSSGVPFVEFFQRNRDGEAKGILLIRL